MKYYAVKGRTGYFTFLVGLARLARPTRTAVEAGWDSNKKDRIWSQQQLHCLWILGIENTFFPAFTTGMQCEFEGPGYTGND
ncbi:uncharacterized protein TrAtP1_003112 [Trichoderma atroviride]|uniref:uncharacterized protein n=1 Tax=Hypocrea atroviridis TaxID=63577 RepID=UPI003320F791|nr:hypothetical protein TrAtP1_003112 [Trichoderma atroviride]